MSSKYSPTEKLIMSNYAPLETIQLLSETFFNIIDNKRDVPDDHPVYGPFILKVAQVNFLKELIKREIYSLMRTFRL